MGLGMPLHILSSKLQRHHRNGCKTAGRIPRGTWNVFIPLLSSLKSPGAATIAKGRSHFVRWECMVASMGVAVTTCSHSIGSPLYRSDTSQVAPGSLDAGVSQRH